MQYRPTPHTHETLQISVHHAETHTKYPSTTPRLTPNIRAPHRDPHHRSVPRLHCGCHSPTKRHPTNAEEPRSASARSRPFAKRNKTSLPSETQYRKPDNASSWRSRQRPKHAHAAMPERPNASTQPQCPSGSRTGTAAMPERPKTPRRPCNHHTAMPERSMASGPRHQDTQATITPQCPSGPWTSTAAMPERLRDNHHTAMPERSMDKRSRNARAAQGQPRTRHTAMPRTSTAAMPERPRDTYTASTPQCPSGPCKQSAMPDRPRSNNGGEHQG